MAAYAALVSLLNNIEQMMIHPRLSTSLHNNQIQTLQEKAGFLLGLIEGYDYGGVIKEAEDLERQITSAAHAAEDVIESHIVHKIHARSNRASRGWTVDLRQMIQDMDAILRKANELKEIHAIKEEQPTQSRHPTETGENAMVGFDDELIQLMDELTSQRSIRHIISIVGMGGTGKTTLAKNIYANQLTIEHFDIRAWATVSQQFNVLESLSQLLFGQGSRTQQYDVEEVLSQLLPGQGSITKQYDIEEIPGEGSRTVDELGEQLHKTLSGRRYLIVLDDIWSVEAWDEVSCFFPDNGNRSRIVLTTRLSNVARDCASNSCFRMKPLNKHESWKLFCQKAFQQKNCPYPELEKVGKEIARLCRGLPLSTVVIGGLLLKSPMSLQFWENVARNIKSNPDSKEKEECLDILSLSYNHLPLHLKPCFLYMGVFKKDSEIRVSEIIKLWIAEGFLRVNNTQVLEEVAEGYLKELIDRNLILVSKRRHNGKTGSCDIHDLLRDLCLKVGEQQEFFHVSEGEIRGTERRLIRSNMYGILHNVPQFARSILAGSVHGQPVKHKLLRVWDAGRTESPRELYGNVNLRYLAYELSYHLQPVWKLPTSVSLIWNLQTLIMQEFWSDTIVAAPIKIWQMRQLRHVKCAKIYLPDPPPSDGLFVMDKLQTLTRAVNLRLSEEVCKRIPNVKKLHLVYDDDLQGYDYFLIESLSNLHYLHKLESLNLSVPRLYPEVVSFPISLNKLSLSGCGLRWEDVSVIGSLPQLEVLQLEKYSMMDEQECWSPIEGQFLRLKFLKLERCDLQYWNADSSHFPVLEKLILSRLWYLEEIPLSVGDIPTLELIRVDECSNSAAISALKIKEDQLESQGNDALQIQLRMCHLEVECFKKRVETEGLTINDIKLDTY